MGIQQYWKEKEEYCNRFFRLPIRYTFSTRLIYTKNDFLLRYKKYRNAAKYYNHRCEVKDFYFSRYKQCDICGATKNLTLDHIVSVYQCAQDKIPIECMNCEKNLRVLCGSCNSRISVSTNAKIPCIYCKRREFY